MRYLSIALHHEKVVLLFYFWFTDHEDLSSFVTLSNLCDPWSVGSTQPKFLLRRRSLRRRMQRLFYLSRLLFLLREDLVSALTQPQVNIPVHRRILWQAGVKEWNYVSFQMSPIVPKSAMECTQWIVFIPWPVILHQISGLILSLLRLILDPFRPILFPWEINEGFIAKKFETQAKFHVA